MFPAVQLAVRLNNWLTYILGYFWLVTHVHCNS